MADPRRELVSHLHRLAGWSTGSLAAGAFLVATGTGAAASAGWVTAGWALVNLAICAAGYRDRKPVVLTKFREFLALNLGLNVAYLGVGVAMAILGSRAVAAAGLAVAIQGLALLVLDGVLMLRLPKPPA